MGNPQALYNSFFARSLQHRAIMEAFLQKLPEPFRSQIDLDTLTRSDSVGINEKLEEHRQDVTYRARLRDGGILVIRIEHQSSPDGSMLTRLLHYAADSIESCCQDHGETPMLIQFLLYHGEQSPYPHHTNLADCYKHPKWGSQELTIRCHLLDLTQRSDAELLKDGHFAVLALMLKHARDANFGRLTDDHRRVFQHCIAAVGDSYLRSMLDYAASLKPGAGKKTFEFIKKVLTDKQAIVMTYGEQLIQEGVQQGVRQGIEQGVRQGIEQGVQQEKLGIARNMLHQLHLGIEVVQQATGLSRQELARL